MTRTVTHTVTRTVVEERPVPCEYQIPTPPVGETFDQDLVNLRFSYDGSAGPQDILKAGAADQCENDPDPSKNGGWHYDAETAPTKILLCPSTCGAVTSVTGARVSVILGCPSKPKDIF